jgi:hypothetical protein
MQPRTNDKMPYNPNKLVVIQRRWLAPWQQERAMSWNGHFERVLEKQSLLVLIRRWFRTRLLTLIYLWHERFR